MSNQYLKKWFGEPNLLFAFLTKYHGSLNHPSRANGDFHEQIFACDCKNSGETLGSNQLQPQYPMAKLNWLTFS